METEELRARLDSIEKKQNVILNIIGGVGINGYGNINTNENNNQEEEEEESNEEDSKEGKKKRTKAKGIDS